MQPDGFDDVHSWRMAGSPSTPTLTTHDDRRAADEGEEILRGLRPSEAAGSSRATMTIWDHKLETDPPILMPSFLRVFGAVASAFVNNVREVKEHRDSHRGSFGLTMTSSDSRTAELEAQVARLTRERDEAFAALRRHLEATRAEPDPAAEARLVGLVGNVPGVRVHRFGDEYLVVAPDFATEIRVYGTGYAALGLNVRVVNAEDSPLPEHVTRAPALNA